MMASPGRALRVGGFVVGAFAAALVLLLVTNRIDEDLTPEARAFYESGKTPQLSDASGFAMIVGFSAPVEQDPRRYGVEWSLAVAAAGKDRRKFPTPRNALTVNAAPEILCRPEEFDCPVRYSSKPQSIMDLAADHSVLLQRYRELQSRTDLGDAGIWAAYDAPLFDYSTIIQTQGVFLSQVAVMASAGDIDSALLALEADAAFYRRWMAESRLLISKLIAVRGLGRDLLLAMQIARRAKELTPAQRLALRRIAVPLSKPERAMSPLVRSEAAFVPNSVDRARESRGERQKFIAQESPLFADLLGLALLRDATLNHAYRLIHVWEQVDALESRDLPAKISEIYRETGDLERPQWSWLYNLGGKVLVAKSWGGMDSYIYRIRDADALANLACAIFDIRDNGVAPGSIEDHLAKSMSACRDPYTGQPFRWDSATQRLWFAPKGDGSAERLGGTKDRIAYSPY